MFIFTTESGNMMNEQKLKDLAAEFAKGIKTEDDLNQFTRLLTKLTVETALNAELTEHLGHEKNARKNGSNARNGYSSKTVLSDDGEIEITCNGQVKSDTGIEIIVFFCSKLFGDKYPNVECNRT